MKVFIISTLAYLLAISCVARSRSSTQPNFVIIMTDDQDMVLNGLLPMTKTQELLSQEGMTFINAFTTTPICCPSRASFLTGGFAHNHRTMNNSKNGGCYNDFWQQLEMYSFPAMLNANGYKTFYAGKYLNNYYGNDIPEGYDSFYGLQGNSKYYNYKLNENGVINDYASEYLTDVLLQRSLSLIDDQTNATEQGPFMMIIAPPAPHSPFTAADKYVDKFPDIKAFKTPNFNKQSPDKHWLLTMPPSKLPSSTLKLIDDIYRKRWQTLLSVDDMVEAVVKALEEKGFLENTYVFYTSDNGYHLGQNGQAYDKRQPYDTDIRVPLIVRGPKIPKKSVSNDLVALLDFGPTLLELANVEVGGNLFDGISFAPSLIQKSLNAVIKRTKLLIEYWGEGNEQTYNPDCPWSAKDNLNQCTKDAACHCQDSRNNTYNCIRHVEEQTTDYLYCEFNDTQNYVEAYNLLDDPYQMTNIGYSEIPSIRAHYQLLISDMIECQGRNCVN